MIPVASFSVRQAIEVVRTRSMANPQNERESADAPSNVLPALWKDLYQLGITNASTDEPIPYSKLIDPEVD